MISETALCQSILDFWFSPDCQAKWFDKDAAFDAQIVGRFASAWERAATGAFADWEGSANACLALLILLDQLPRNMFRATPKAFATDARALAVARRATARGYDLATPPPRRVFFYLPFEHAEDLAAQEEGEALYAANIDWPEALAAARRHHEIIARFGRFPHRNAWLGRVTTEAEAAFLAEPNSAF
jgi:uncharacterized protein (DUF924 family)